MGLRVFAENSTVTESEADTEADTDKDSVVDRLLLFILLNYCHWWLLQHFCVVITLSCCQ